MVMDLSKDIKPISELKRNTAGVIGYAKRSRRPVLITQNGLGVAIIQGVEDYQNERKKILLLEALARGGQDVQEGRVVPLETVLDDLQAWLKK